MKKEIRIVVIATVLLLLFSSAFVAGASAVQKDDKAEKAKEIAKKIEKDLRETGKYLEKDLEELIEVVKEAHNVTLSEEEKEGAKEYALREIKKKIKLERLKKRATSKVAVKPEKIISEDGTAYKILTTGPVSTFLQPTVDINGGSGYDDNNNYYDVEGNNDLYNVEVEQVYLYEEDTYCPVDGLAELYTMYTMYYYDEDHRDPEWDAFYDDLREAIYGRIEDIETFYVRASDNSICFDEIWSNDETFYPFWGQHGIATFPYTSTIYIAVWNHALDVDDDNPSLSKVEMP